jgi:hypothetical protein
MMGIISNNGWILFFGKGTAMMQKKDGKQIMREFGLRQSRQFLAIAVILLLLLFLTLLYRRHDIFGVFTKEAVIAAQILLITAFIGFSVFNWRCPSCKKYLGGDINRRICKKCGARLR